MGNYHLDPETIEALTKSPRHAGYSFGAYKWVDKKINPVAQAIPPEFKVTRTMSYDSLLTLVPPNIHFKKVTPTNKFTQEHIDKLTNEMHTDNFLLPKEIQMFLYILVKNEAAIAFEDIHRKTLKESYFSPYKIPHVPHVPWQDKNIPIPPGLRDKVMELFQLKIKAGVYEPCQSPYRSHWICTWIP